MADTPADLALPAESPAQIDFFRSVYDPDLDFRKLASEATYFTRGFRLVEKDDLIGVPHVIISVTYREGYVTETGIKGDYVSVEAVTADAATLDSPQVKSMTDSRELAVYPNEAVVYNDGGKGIRRSLTELFTRMGLVNPGYATQQDENPADRPFSLWVSGEDAATSGIIADANGEKFRYVAMRGLRKSDYDSPYGPATTFYFA